MRELSIIIVISMLLASCSAPDDADSEASAPAGTQTQRERPIRSISETAFIERFTGKSRTQIKGFFGEPESITKLPYRDRAERWTYRVDLHTGQGTYRHIDILMSYGKYVTAYGIPEQIDANRRQRRINQTQLARLTDHNTAAQIRKALGAPDWINLTRDGGRSWSYDMWLESEDTLFPGFTLFFKDERVEQISYQLQGKRKIGEG